MPMLPHPEREATANTIIVATRSFFIRYLTLHLYVILFEEMFISNNKANFIGLWLIKF